MPRILWLYRYCAITDKNRAVNRFMAVWNFFVHLFDGATGVRRAALFAGIIIRSFANGVVLKTICVGYSLSIWFKTQPWGTKTFVGLCSANGMSETNRQTQ